MSKHNIKLYTTSIDNEYFFGVYRVLCFYNEECGSSVFEFYWDTADTIYWPSISEFIDNLNNDKECKFVFDVKNNNYFEYKNGIFIISQNNCFTKSLFKSKLEDRKPIIDFLNNISEL